MFVHPRFAYRRSSDQDRTAEHPVIVIGAGMVGLTVAIDLAQHGIDVVVLDDDDTVSVGSRSICQAKRTLEIWDRLHVAAPMLAKGVTWTTGKVFFGERQIYGFDLQPEGGRKFPAFINLQQYYVEHFLVQRAQQEKRIELRWKQRVSAVEQRGDLVLLTVDTPDGAYRAAARYAIACDGVRSPMRHALGLDFPGQAFEDRFLIADVRMKADFPTERWFWFEPPFHRGGSTLLHRQADDVWRIDFQLGLDADPDEERKPERVTPRIRAMLGDVAFELEWVSVYTFQCRRLERFRHGRVIFAGDAAHTVSPFGARGGNGGVQDADNLAWKLAHVLRGEAPDSLLDSYDAERIPAADENILNSTRATDFITPKSAMSRVFRDAVLTLAANHPFARRLVNSGRLSVPAVYRDSPLSTHDEDEFAAGPPPGAPALDAPLAQGFLCEHLGSEFTLLTFGSDAPSNCAHVSAPAHGMLAERYDARPGTTYLFRPDQYVAARWRRADPTRIARAIARAKGAS